MPELQYITLGLAGLAAVAAIAAPIVLYVVLMRRVRMDVSRLISHLDQTLASSLKLVEVRDFYAEVSGELRKMLDEAFRDGNKPRQMQLRKLSDRLDALKARTLDNAVRLLEPGAAGQAHGLGRRRRRHRGRGFQPRPGGQGQPHQPGQQPRPGGPPQPRTEGRPPERPPQPPGPPRP